MASVPPGGDIASVLCRLSVIAVGCLNEKDFDFESPPGAEVTACVAEDFKCVVSPWEQSWTQMTAHWRDVFSPMPNCHFEIDNMSALVNDKKGVTTIFFNLRGRDIGGAERDWVIEHTWRRAKDDKWFWSMLRNLQGLNVKQGYGF